MPDVITTAANPAIPGQPFSVDLDAVPSGDMKWDDIFPSQPEPVAPASTTQPLESAPAATPVAQPPVSDVPSDFIKTSTGTVYKTADEAIKGIEHKDALIEQLRNRFILERGVDPVTNRPVATQANQPSNNYMENQEQYLKDLFEAAQKGDQAKYFKTQVQLIDNYLAPLAPLISNTAKQQAVSAVSAEIKDFGSFHGSDAYNAALNQLPTLKQAIEFSENTPAQAARLPELYKIAWLTGQGLRLPEIVKAQAVPAQQTLQATRATVTPTTAVQSGPSVTRPTLSTSAGRKAIIEAMEHSPTFETRI